MDGPQIEFDNFEFLYTNKPIVEKDVVQVAAKFRLYEKLGGFLITDDYYRELKKLPLLVYVDSVDTMPDKTQMIFVKTSKTAGVNKHAYPAALFKAVKIPKMWDLINWMTDGNTNIEFPPMWDFFKSDLQYTVNYLINLFINYPRITREANRLLNSLYTTWDYKEILMYYKNVVQKNQLRPNDLYTKFDGKTARKEFVDICETINPWWTEADAKALYALNVGPRVFDSVSNVDLVKIYKDPKLAMLSKKNNSEGFEEEANRLDELLIENQKQKMMNDKRFLKVINQEIIDEMELTIFNTCTMKSLNSILFTFINKQNQKVYYLQPFEFEFYASYHSSILKNDYIVPFNPVDHTKYRLTNYKDLKSLKYSINNAYDKYMRSGGTL